MQSKHLIMGTAGHVDHGKTSLIKALTGYDCDTHKQEKERGITINLGFWHLDLPDGNSLGIIDVPGHADFIKTMVAGVAGFDLVLLVIAADEGIMPQTREHLEIMKILGIKHGLVVITKIDSVDEDLIQLAVEETREFVADSFLAEAPIIPVSALKKRGLSELLKILVEIFPQVKPKDNSGIFRLYIDRLFTRSGFGTIVNGSVLSGKIKLNDPVYLLPGSLELKIRRMERHGIQVDSLEAGDRASFNLAGFRQKDFKRGMLLSSKVIKPTSLIDVKLKLFKETGKLKLWSQAIFLTSTIRLMCRLHLLDSDELKPGQEGLAQIYLPQESVIMMGDKFILRNSSGKNTLGGGSVIDPYPLHHRRRRDKQIELVEKISSGELAQLITAETKKSPLPIEFVEIAEHLNLKPDELIDTIFRNLPSDISFIQGEDKILLLEKKKLTDLRNRILNNLRDYHRKNPFSMKGRSLNELLGIFGREQNEKTKLILKILLKDFENDGKIRTDGKTWSLKDHKVELDKNIERVISKIQDYIKNADQLYVEFNKIYDHFSKEEFKRDKLEQIINYMLEKKLLYNIKKMLFPADFVEEVKEKLISFLDNKHQGITVAEFRDLLAANRLTSLALLEYFDEQGITIRKENKRFFTSRFQKNRIKLK